MPCNVTWRAAASWQTVAHALFHSELSRGGALPILFFDMAAIQPFRLECLPRSTNGREAIRRVTLMSLAAYQSAARAALVVADHQASTSMAGVAPVPRLPAARS